MPLVWILLCAALLGGAALRADAAGSVPARAVGAARPSPAGAVASCSWDQPGHRAFMGEVPEAIDHYTDIPSEVRARLKRRLQLRLYDDVALITRDAVQGRHNYEPQLRDMHFGDGQICSSISRERWPAQANERGLVYCDSGHCVIVPTVCRNLARVTRLVSAVAAGAAESTDAAARLRGGAGAATPGSTAGTEPAASWLVQPVRPSAPPDSGELRFEPPAAGPSGAGGAVPPGSALPAAPSFEQLSPALAAAAGGATTAPNTPASTLSGPAAAATAGATTPALGAEAAALGNLGAVLPVLAFTSPFASTPVTGSPREASPTPPVPEPGTWVLWLAGLLVVAHLARRRGP